MLTSIGFVYVYFWAPHQASIPNGVAYDLSIRWTSIMLIGLPGIVGAPVDYYFESPRAAAERGKKHRASQTAFCHEMHNKFNLSPW